MDKIATENLFLLEFLVDSVDLNPKCDCAAGEGERCVSFQFLDNAPLDVCEEDFSPHGKQNEKDNVKSGKSCLFSLSPEQANTALNQFDIYVTILKKMPEGWLPERVEIGEALISIANLFTELINSVETSDGTTPTAKTLKDCFNINNSNGEAIGKIGVYIRMSCFGKLIVTQFQMNLEDKSVLFKDKEGKSLYRYKKAGKGRKEACTPRQPPPGMQGQYPAMGMGMGMGMSQGPPCPMTPCPRNQQPGNGMGGMVPPQGNGMAVMVPPPGNGMGGMACPFTPCMMDQQQMGPYGQPPPCQECGSVPNAPCLQMQGGNMGMGMSMGMGMGMGGPMSPCIECGNVSNAPCLPQQAGMGMTGGMAPCVECGNIPNAPCLPPAAPPNSNPNASNSPCVECAGLANPPCASSQPDPEGNYQEISASMGGNTMTIRVHKDKTKVEQIDPNTGAGVPSDDTSSEVGCSCSPGKAGKKEKQERTVNMRPGIHQGNQDMPFSFKMGKAGNGGNNVVVNPPVATAPDGTKFTEFSDPNKELFILRVGKKTEGIDKKQNLELELCTPRGKVL